MNAATFFADFRFGNAVQQTIFDAMLANHAATMARLDALLQPVPIAAAEAKNEQETNTLGGER